MADPIFSTAFPAMSAPKKTLGPGCPHQEWSSGYPMGGDVPAFARGSYAPGDEPGFRCALDGDRCAPYPPECPAWKAGTLPCPVCIELTRWGRVKSEFREDILLEHEDGERLFCPSCDEEYASMHAVAEAAVEKIKDVLDSLGCAEGHIDELREEITELKALSANKKE